MQKSERFSPVYARDISSGVTAGAISGALFFFSIWQIRLRDHWAEKNRSFRAIRYRTIDDKRKSAESHYLGRVFFQQTKNAYAQARNTRIHTHPYVYTWHIHIHARTRVHAYIRHTKWTSTHFRWESNETRDWHFMSFYVILWLYRQRST